MPWFIQVVTQFGLPGLIGLGLGYFLLSTKINENGNILGQTPWHPLSGAIVGSIVFGFVAWFLFGFCLAIST